MLINRREFLKMAGFAALGLTGAVSRDLVYASGAPEITTGIRYAMVVDITKCLENDVFDTVVNACHSIHNVPKFDSPKTEVKWIWTEHYEHAFHEQKHDFVSEDVQHRNVLVFCNHCDNPPCVRVCPTQATWKRDDGIIMMDMHRCIGCRYCVAACPYGSRSFNWEDPRPHIAEIDPGYPTRSKGVVEKCTFCAERLARGQQPACVEACKNNELVFGNLNDPKSKVRELLQKNYSLRRKPSLGTRPEVYYIV